MTEYKVKVTATRTPNPDYIHTVRLVDPHGNVAASAITWTILPKKTEKGNSVVVNFNAKSPEQARRVHEELAKTLDELGLPDEHRIVYSPNKAGFKKSAPHFTGFNAAPGTKPATLTTNLLDYYEHYVPQQETKPEVSTREKNSTRNNVSLDIQESNDVIQRDTAIIRELTRQTLDSKASEVVLRHILQTLPAHLKPHVKLITNANQIIDEDDYSGMAAKLAKLPAKEAKELVEHVKNKTLQITNAMQTLRDHKVYYKVDSQLYDANSAKPSRLNDEAIKINHAFVISHHLNK